MAIDDTIHFGELPPDPFLDSLRPTPSMDQSDLELPHLEGMLGGKLSADGWRIHIAANGLDFLPPKGLQDLQFGNIPCVQDHLDVLKRAGHKLFQLTAGLTKMRIGNDPNFHIRPYFS